MAKDSEEAILAFDTLYTTNHTQMMKLLLPYLEPGHQKKLAVFIKWQELLYTINFSKKYHAPLCGAEFSEKKELDFSALLPLLNPYCDERERQLLSQLSNLSNMMQMYQEVSQYLPFLQQMMEHQTDMTDIMKKFMTPEQMNLFNSFMEGGPL